MKKVFCILITLTLTATVSTFALEVKGETPVFKSQTSSMDQIVSDLNTELSSSFETVLRKIREEVDNVSVSPENFIRAWGNSSVYASHGASQRGYAGYKFFNATVGTMIGFQLPASPFSLISDIDELGDRFKREGDLMLGINPQVFNAQVGINTSKFLLNNLYLGVKFSFFSMDSFEDFFFSTGSFGVTANYQILPTVDILRLIKWRGVSLGSGIIYQRTKVGLSMPMDSYNEPIPNVDSSLIQAGITQPSLRMESDLIVDLVVNTVTIPLEAVTAIKLSIFNFHFGMGADIAFGKSELTYGMRSNIDIEGLNEEKITQEKRGKLSVSDGDGFSPFPFNFKIMTGFGISAGPVIFDIPVTIYFGGGGGYNIGLTLGATW
jgi:hypothetical protein